MKGLADAFSKTVSLCKPFQEANSFLYSKHHWTQCTYRISIKKSFTVLGYNPLWVEFLLWRDVCFVFILNITLKALH